MKLLTELSAVAVAALAVFSSPSAAVSLKGSNTLQDLQPHGFVEVSEAQALENLNAILNSPTGGKTEEGAEKSLMKAIAPAVKSLFKSAARSLKPELKLECERLVAEFSKHHEDEEGEEDSDDFSFVAISSQKSFWDTVKKGLGTIADMASPLIARVADKLGPTIEKMGAKVAPQFAKAIREMLRAACDEEAGVEHDHEHED